MTRTNNKQKNKLTFWGVRGSMPTPDSQFMETGGNTACVQIETADGQQLIFDMGTGIYNLGTYLQSKDQKKLPPLHIFLSHVHWDHIQGMAFFNFLFDPKVQIIIYGMKSKNQSLKEILSRYLQAPYWPVTFDDLSAQIQFKEIGEGVIFKNGNIQVESMLHRHPNGALGFRVQLDDKIIVYSTDTEHPNHSIDESVCRFSQDADILIHDAHFTPEDLPKYIGWGHSSWEKAIQVAKQANVKSLVLFHFSPEYDDNKMAQIEIQAKNLFENLVIAREGLTIEIPT